MKLYRRYLVAAALFAAVASVILLARPPRAVFGDPRSRGTGGRVGEEEAGQQRGSCGCERSPDRPKTGGGGSPLPDDRGEHDLKRSGERGRGVVLVGREERRAQRAIKTYQVNTLVSDLIPLNRLVPDSRPSSCKHAVYDEHLPSTSIIIPFHNEWLSVLLRTVYSFINRTPRHILREIILVDDASSLISLKGHLDTYIADHFEEGLVKIIRLPVRSGLIKARLEGFRHVTGEVVSFSDSHVEVNVGWLEPLLMEIRKNRSTLAMGQLDYISATTFQYDFTPGYRTRYGFNWAMVFFETYFRKDQLLGKNEMDSLLGVAMVGSAFAVNTNYFKEIGTYDAGMKIWGGENLELAWRVWLCGGRLVHVPCSHIGHIARKQPYKFPDGYFTTLMHNYKRAVDVWLGDYKEYVYRIFPQMKDVNRGDISDRLAIKNRMKCKRFDWFLDHIWPELFAYDKNVYAWGELRNLGKNICLDNEDYLFQDPKELKAQRCNSALSVQGFSWTHDLKLRTTLHCVSIQNNLVVLENCFIGPSQDTWQHSKGSYIQHIASGLCLTIGENNIVVLKNCNLQNTQKWLFTNYKYSSPKTEYGQNLTAPA